MRRSVGRAVLFLGLLSVPFSASGAEVLTLSGLVKEALRRNPDIRAAKAEWLAARAKVPQVKALPDPRISVGSMMKSTGVSFVQPLPYPEKLSVAGRLAAVEAERRRALLEAVARRVLADVAEAYYDLWEVYKSIEVVEENRRLMDQLRRVAEALYAVGRAAQSDVVRAQVELTKLSDRLVALRQRLGSIEARLNRLLNRPAGAPLGRPSEALLPPFDVDLEGLLSLSERKSPLIRARLLGVESGRLALRLAKLDFMPDFLLSLGWRGGRVKALEWGVGVEIPLYWRRKQRFGVKEAERRLEAAEEAYESTKAEVAYKVRDLLERLKAARELAILYDTTLIPQATTALQASLSAYKVGKMTFLTVVDNFITLLNYRLSYFREVAEANRLLNRLGEVTGEFLAHPWMEKALAKEVLSGAPKRLAPSPRKREVKPKPAPERRPEAHKVGPRLKPRLAPRK